MMPSEEEEEEEEEEKKKKEEEDARRFLETRIRVTIIHPNAWHIWDEYSKQERGLFLLRRRGRRQR